MDADHPISTVPTLQYLIENNLHVLLYSAEFDLNCNTLGTLHTLESNRWRNKVWSKAERSLWKSQGDVAGEYFTIDDIFAFMIVRNSGHLMPMDIPLLALDMLDRFINEISFKDVSLKSEEYYLQLLNGDTEEESANVVSGTADNLESGFNIILKVITLAVAMVLTIAILVVAIPKVYSQNQTSTNPYNSQGTFDGEPKEVRLGEYYYQSIGRLEIVGDGIL